MKPVRVCDGLCKVLTDFLEVALELDLGLIAPREESQKQSLVDLFLQLLYNRLLNVISHHDLANALSNSIGVPLVLVERILFLLRDDLKEEPSDDLGESSLGEGEAFEHPQARLNGNKNENQLLVGPLDSHSATD